MSKFATMIKIRPGLWTEDGEITVHVDQIAALEEEPGCGGDNTRVTLSGGREVCVRGELKVVRKAVVKIGLGPMSPDTSIFDQIFGPARRGAW